MNHMVERILSLAKSRDIAIVASIALLSGLYIAMGLQTDFPGISSDALVYIMQAEWVRGNAPDWANDWIRLYPFPPAYSLWLALFGASPTEPERALVANAVSYCLSMAAFWFFLHRRADKLVIVASLVLSYGSYAFIMQTRTVGSEGLYMVFSFLALSLLGKEETQSRERLMFVAMFVFLALQTRTIGYALVPMLALALVRFRGNRLIPALCLIVPTALVACYAWLVSDADSSYADNILSRDPLANVLGWVAENSRAMLDAAGELAGIYVLGVGLLVLGAVSTIIGMWRGSALSVYLVVYVLIVLVWPYPGHAMRFLVPVWPLICYLALEMIVRATKNAVINNLGVVAVAASAIMVSAGALFQLHSLELEEELERYRYTDVVMQNPTADGVRFAEVIHRARLTAEAAKAVINEGDCFCSTTPQFGSFYASRRSSRLVASSAVEHVRKQLNACPYLFVIGVGNDLWNRSVLYPADDPDFGGTFDARLMASMEDGSLAAALFTYNE